MKRTYMAYGVAVCIVLGAIAKFVPVYNKTGTINNGNQGLCIGYGSTPVKTYRVIPNGLKEFNEHKVGFVSDSPNTSCGEPVHLKLYIW